MKDYYKLNESLNYKRGNEIHFGNTGLLFNIISESQWKLHFMPDNYVSKVRGREAEFSSRFFLGLNLLSKYSESIEHPTFAYGIANNEMHNFFINCFRIINPDVYNWQILPDKKYPNIYFSINLNLLIETLKLLINENSQYSKLVKRAEYQYSSSGLAEC